MTFRVSLAACTAALLVAGSADASVTFYSSQSAFQSALTGSYTLVNLDAAPMNAFASGYHLDDAGPAAALATLGLDSVAYNARVVTGQDGQIPTPGRDRLILNGTTFGGEIVFNFTGAGVNGIGGWSNDLDGGHVQAYSGLNGGGALLGSAPFGTMGGGGSFGGLISSDLIKSVRFTCEFNGDLACGVYDVQFGTVAAVGGGVPEPAAWALMLLGFAGLGAALRGRRAATIPA